MVTKNSAAFGYALYGQCFFEKWSSLMPLHSGTLHTQDLPCCIFEEESAQKTFLFVVYSNLIPEWSSGGGVTNHETVLKIAIYVFVLLITRH